MTMSMTMLIGFLYYRYTPARASCTIAQGHSPSLHAHVFHAVGDDDRTSADGVCVDDAHPIIRRKAQNKGSSALRVPVSAAHRIGRLPLGVAGSELRRALVLSINASSAIPNGAAGCGAPVALRAGA